MASTKLQKPSNEKGSTSHEEHKFGQKISEMTAKVFGQKQHEHQASAKHCTTCRCPAPHNSAKPASTDQERKKEHAATGPTASVNDMKSSNTCSETKKKENDGKHTSCIEVKKKDKKQTVIAPTKESKPAHHYFSSMTEHIKEKIMMIKKTKDDKSKDSCSSSSDSSESDSEDEACGKKKQKSKTVKIHTQEIKHVSK
ncbi:hypothetical protein vseg_016881 [Gypsophila vaccaria]